MKIESEKILCEKFIEAHPRREFLFFEVNVPGGRCDLVHKETSIVTIYEAKMRLSIDLLEQCINRKPYAHFVYAVVPEKRKGNGFIAKLFEDYGIGVISMVNVSGWPIDHPKQHYSISELKKPSLNRYPKSITIYEENKTEVAGSQHAGITPFGIMVKRIKEVLVRGELPIDEVFQSQTYYNTLKQFKSNTYAWIRNGVIEGIGMKNGKMYLVKEKEVSHLSH